MSLLIQENVLLKPYTTLQTGGVARYMLTVTNLAEVEEAARFIAEKKLSYLVLGGGSNILVPDEGFEGVVILNQLKGMSYLEETADGIILEAGAGEVFDEVVAETVQKGYWGLENLSSIPGTVGATPVQNVGAYGVEMSNVIVGVDVYDMKECTPKYFSVEECEFAYRESFFKTDKGKKYFITAVYIRLQKNPTPKIAYADLQKRFLGAEPTLAEIRESIISIRSEKFPDWKVIGTAGSFFKNPVIDEEHADTLKKQFPELPMYEAGVGMFKIPLGYVLDKVCRLKGIRYGQVGLYEQQALVLINYGDASTEEIKKFAKTIIDVVFKKTKIVITPEVQYIETK